MSSLPREQEVRGRKRQPRLRVGFILARRFTLCAFANFVDVLRLAADEGDRSRPILCRWSVLSDTMDPVTSSCGVVVQPNARLSDPRDFDYVVVVGGLIDEMDNLGAGTIHFLREAAAAKVPLIGVCTGALILHMAGLMDGYRCCVSWFHHADFLEQFAGLVPVSDRIYVIDRDRLTCSGGASSAHLAAHLVERHVSEAAAHKSLQIMIIDEALRGEKPQPGMSLELVTTDDVVKRALLQMHRNLEVPLTIDDVARRLGMSRRSLERRFEKVLGRPPSDCYVTMRLEQAQMMLRNTAQTVATIAAATGFCDTSHLARALKRHRGSTPTALRREASSIVSVSTSARREWIGEPTF
jgi:transcriptional regulator GlxA family with amidase domain